MYTALMADNKNFVPDANYDVRSKLLDNKVSFGVGERTDLSK